MGLQQDPGFPLNRTSFQSTSILSCDPLPPWPPLGFLLQPATGLTMVLAFSTVNGTALVYLQTPVRPHAPARALPSTTSADRLVPPSLRANNTRSVKSQLFCFGTSVVEQTPDRCQDSRVARHLPQKTQDSSVQTSPPPRIAWHERTYMHLYILIVSALITALKVSLINSSYDPQMRAWQLFPFSFLLPVMFRGFFLVTNVHIVSRFGQKRLLHKCPKCKCICFTSSRQN